MAGIVVEHNPERKKLEKMGLFKWPIWEKEVSVFAWSYDRQEMCYFLEGEVVVTPHNGEPVSFGKGDLVTFPQGMECTWDVRRPVRKHYRFG